MPTVPAPTRPTYPSASDTPPWTSSDDTIPPTPHPTVGDLPLATFFSLSQNPVLTAADVTDYGDVDYVADPFLYYEPGGPPWHMFFEVSNSAKDPVVVQGHATSSDLYSWAYDQVVLSVANSRVSFNQVWKHNGIYYIAPAQSASQERTQIFEAATWPTDWSLVCTPVDRSSGNFNDGVIFQHPASGRWWIIANSDSNNSDLGAWYSDDLRADNWTAHDNNPVVTGRPRGGRPGGRAIPMQDGSILLPLMDNLRYDDSTIDYGRRVRLWRITDLSPSSYTDEMISAGPCFSAFEESSWASWKCHTWDPWWLGPDKGWAVALDGRPSSENVWRIGIGIIPAKNQTIEIDSSQNQLSWDPSPWTSYWPMAEGTGDLAHDVISNLYLRKFGPTWANGGLSFDGNDDYAVHRNRPELKPTTVSLGVEITPQTVSSDGIIAGCIDQNQQFSLRLSSNGEYRFPIRRDGQGSNDSISGGSPSVGSTDLVFGTYDGSNQRLLINGSEVASQSVSGDLNQGESDFGLGSNLGGANMLEADLHRLWFAQQAVSSSAISDIQVQFS